MRDCYILGCSLLFFKEQGAEPLNNDLERTLLLLFCYGYIFKFISNVQTAEYAKTCYANVHYKSSNIVFKDLITFSGKELTCKCSSCFLYILLYLTIIG